MKTARGWFQRLTSRERRTTERIAEPSLVAYYWDGDKPKGHVVRDISSAGLYLLTEDRWYPRTLVRLTLQATIDGEIERSITVETMVVRVGSGGVGFRFLPQDEHHAGSAEYKFSNGADRKTLENFLSYISLNLNEPPKPRTLSITR